MNNSPLALTIDLGTQSCRVCLIDKQGNIFAVAKNRYNPPYYSKEKGYAEQNPDYYFDVIKKGLKEIASKHKDVLKNVVGATITTFRDSSVQLDENNKPVRDMILWLDQRTAEAREPLPLLHRILFWVIGMKPTIDLNRRRTPAHWIKENEPENWAKVKKYVNISGYLTYKLTGSLIDSAASVAGHYPIYFKKRVWYKEGALKGRIYGIPNSMLCELKQPGEVLGTITDELAEEVGLPRGIKLYASGSDKACETIGLGALNNDFAAVSYGTASSVEVSSKTFHNPEPYLPAYPAAVDNWYNMEVQVYRGYWMINWFAKEFANEAINDSKIAELSLEEFLNKKTAEIPPGSDGLVLQPYWGPGLRRPLAKGAIIGFRDIHTKYHLYRAIIEGIAYALKEGLEGIEKKLFKKVKEIRISGGGSQSDLICQITADIFGVPVSRVQTYETSSLGAALAVFVAAKEFKDAEEATKAMVHPSDKFEPNQENCERYEYLYRKGYLKMFPKLNGIYKDLFKYSKKYDQK